ncbi:MAG: DNA-directed RNA polymerase [Candidatus Aenigmarchaeota archaeon]|nr:DNA-directed RNA polymerase [Candidatus Aenigmarchaeota archaeon]
MFKTVTIKDNVRVLPAKFGLEINDAIKESLQETIEGKIFPELGVLLAVTDVMEVGEGSIVPEDGAIHYPAQFKILVYRPEVNEMVLGEVVDVTEFGAFTRIGPIDALIHVSQVMDDKMAYDPKNSVFTGKKTGNKLQEGNIIRARVVGVSLGKGRSKISLTMRQPCMGALEWLERDKKKTTKEPKKEEKK